jgi:uncharacterized protein YchJ
MNNREERKFLKDKTRTKKNKAILRAKKEQGKKERKELKETRFEIKLQRQIDGTNRTRQHFNIHKNLPGRNKKCFCGSDKKFKLCCWPKVKDQVHSDKVQFVVDKNLNIA